MRFYGVSVEVLKALFSSSNSAIVYEAKQELNRQKYVLTKQLVRTWIKLAQIHKGSDYSFTDRFSDFVQLSNIDQCMIDNGSDKEGFSKLLGDAS